MSTKIMAQSRRHFQSDRLEQRKAANPTHKVECYCCERSCHVQVMYGTCLGPDFLICRACEESLKRKRVSLTRCTRFDKFYKKVLSGKLYTGLNVSITLADGSTIRGLSKANEAIVKAFKSEPKPKDEWRSRT